MRYLIQACNKETGSDVEFFIDADSEMEACHKAADIGLLVSKATKTSKHQPLAIVFIVIAIASLVAALLLGLLLNKTKSDLELSKQLLAGLNDVETIIEEKTKSKNSAILDASVDIPDDQKIYFYTMNLGDIGYLPNHWEPVTRDNMRVGQSYSSVGSKDGQELVAVEIKYVVQKVLSDGVVLEQQGSLTPLMAYLRGISVEGLITGRRYQPAGVYKVTGTESFETVSRGAITVFVLDLINWATETVADTVSDPVVEREINGLIAILRDQTVSDDAKREAGAKIISYGKEAIPIMIKNQHDETVCFPKLQIVSLPSNPPPGMQTTYSASVGSYCETLIRSIIKHPDDRTSGYKYQGYEHNIKDWSSWWEENKSKTLDQIQNEVMDYNIKDFDKRY